MSQNRIIRAKELRMLTGLSASSIWRQEQLARFPKRIQIGQRSVGWLASEVEQWIKEKHDQRGDGNAAN